MTDPRSMMHEHHAAVAAAVAGTHPAGRQLLQAQFMLAPWTDRHTRVAGSLPFPLDHGPVELLQRVLILTTTPFASAKLLDDAVILLMYGASYLQDHYDETRSRQRIEDWIQDQKDHHEQWISKARGIQMTWRTQRFHTNRLPVLAFDTSSFLQPEVDELMRRKQLKPGDSVENLAGVQVPINEPQLEEQVLKYADELRKRVEARRRDEDEQQRKELKDQQMQEEKRKRMILQRKKRHENACRRWHYFTTRLLRMIRQDSENGKQQPPKMVIAPTLNPNQPVQNNTSSEKSVIGSKTMARLFKNPVRRTLVRRFVAKAIARGVSRVLCMYNMGDGELQSMDAPNSIQEITTSSGIVLRLGLLLCDLHFGIKYAGLYQRFFDRAAKQRGLRVEWRVFNCLNSQFPTKAHTRMLNGYLVAGGPNIGVATVMPHGASAQAPVDDRIRSNVGARKNRHVGPWRRRLLTFLRELHSQKQTLLGGLGLGHVILAEALGARIAMREWEDGWCALDPMIFINESSVQSLDHHPGQGMQGVKYLHGEFVETFGSFKNGYTNGRNRLNAWRSRGEHSFVACFRDTLTLSIDGSPECGTFVFETLNEFYDREKASLARQSTSSETEPMTTRRKSLTDDVYDEDEDGDDEDFQSIVVATAPSLEEKRKRMNIIDASERIAFLFLDHFRRQVVTTTTRTVGTAFGNTMSVTGAVCSSDVLRVDSSLQHLMSLDRTTGVFMNVTASIDGHLMVTNPKAFAFIVDQDKRIREQLNKQRLSSSTVTGNLGVRNCGGSCPPGLTLSSIRDNEHRGISSSGSSRQMSPRAIHLPSIRRESGAASLVDEVSNNSMTEHRRPLIRRVSSISSNRSAESVTTVGASVLTLSQALTLIVICTLQQSANSPKLVFIRLLDEECKQTHDLLPLSKADLRTTWLRLSAAIRIADLRSDQIAIVSRYSFVLDYIKRKRPTWTFVKDCRRSQMPHRKRLKKVAQYAAYADIVLFDQDFLLSNSATENDALLRKAKSFGLQVYVAPREEVTTNQTDTSPPKRPQFYLQKKFSSSNRTYRRLSKEISAKTSQGDSEYDMQVVEFMLLQFSGLDGVITSHPEAAIDAQQRIAAKSEAMQQVEQLFRDWQAKDSAKTASPKRTSGTVPQADLTLDDDDPEDYVGDESHHDSDDSLPEDVMVEEMARQKAEHSYVGPSRRASSGTYGVGSLSPSIFSNGPLTAAPFIPLRPLQPKNGDDVFGAGAIRRQIKGRGFVSSFSRSERSGRVSSIGSFRAALKRTSAMEQPPSVRDESRRDDGDSRIDLRRVERTSPLMSTRSLKPMTKR